MAAICRKRSGSCRKLHKLSRKLLPISWLGAFLFFMESFYIIKLDLPEKLFFYDNVIRALSACNLCYSIITALFYLIIKFMLLLFSLARFKANLGGDFTT